MEELETTTTTPRTTTTIAIQFFLGIGLSLLLIGVPLSYFWFFSPGLVQPFHLIAATALVLLGGIAAALFGAKVIEPLVKLVESFPAS